MTVEPPRGSWEPLGTLASPEVDQGTHGLNPEVDQDSRVLHLIYFWGDLLLADLLLGMPV